MSVLLNNGDGSFQTPQTFATDQSPVQTVVADVNGDGLPDLVTVSNHDSAIGVLLGKGNGSFEPATAGSGVGLSDTPFLADLNGDGIPDSVVLDQLGQHPLSRGTARRRRRLRPARDPQPRPARARSSRSCTSGRSSPSPPPTLTSTPRCPPVNSSSPSRFTRSAQTVIVSRRTAFSTHGPAHQPRRRRPDGKRARRPDRRQRPGQQRHHRLSDLAGQFAAPITVPAGIAPSDIAVADVNGDGLPDIIVTDQASGDVTVLLNDPAHAFSQSLRFRASTGLYGLDTTSGSPAVSSFAQSVSLVAGDFTGDGRDDLAVVNQATHSFTVLAADGNGGFANPQLGLTTSTSDGLSINDRPGRDRGRRLQPRRPRWTWPC